MRTTLVVAGSAALLVGLVGGPAHAVLPDSAATAKTFTSCAKLLKVYPKGVARDSAAAAWAVAADFSSPRVSAPVYRANAKRLDKGGLGVLCPRPADVVGPQARYEALAGTLQAQGATCLLIRSGGRITGEWYWSGRTPSTQTTGFSTMKALSGALVASASDLGKLAVDQKASDFITSWRGTPSQDVTIRQILSMTSGRQTGPGDGMAMTLSGNATAYAIELGQAAPPGTLFALSDSSVQTLAAVLPAATGSDVVAFAKKRLLGPLGMTATTLNPVTGGGANMFGDYTTSCRDLSRLTQMYLDSGTFAGRQVISADYAQEARSPGSPLNANYGLLMELNTTGAPSSLPGTPGDAFSLQGMCGQVSTGFPSTGTVITVMTSATLIDALSCDPGDVRMGVMTSAILQAGNL